MPAELVATHLIFGEGRGGGNKWQLHSIIISLSHTLLALASSSVILCEGVAPLSLALMQSTLIELFVTFSEKFEVAPSGRALRRVALYGYRVCIILK